jgi:molecular chaperone DnaK
LGDKIAPQDKDAIHTAMERTRQAASGEDAQAIRQAVSDLQVAAQAMAQHMNRPSADGAAPEAGGGESKTKDDVIDAEFEVKK